MYCFDCIILFRKIYRHHCFGTGPARIRIDVVSILVSVFREDVGHRFCFVGHSFDRGLLRGSSYTSKSGLDPGCEIHLLLCWAWHSDGTA